jgi:single-stranded DNA-binding protein
MDKNSVVLIGSLAGVAQRPIGQQGRTLVELRLAVSRPGRKGEGEVAEVVPVIIWDGRLGDALLDLAPGTPLTVVGRVSARSWTPAGGGAERIFTEVVAEQVLVDATRAAPGEPAAATAPTSTARPEPRAATRPGIRPSERRDDDVPF